MLSAPVQDRVGRFVRVCTPCSYCPIKAFKGTDKELRGLAFLLVVEALAALQGSPDTVKKGLYR